MANDDRVNFPESIRLSCWKCWRCHVVRGRTREACKRSVRRSGWRVEGEIWNDEPNQGVIATCRKCVTEIEDEGEV